jgi:hypothetical protein
MFYVRNKPYVTLYSEVHPLQALKFCTGCTAYRGIGGKFFPFMTTALEEGER